MTVQELLSYFEGVKPSGKRKWMALCPAHADKNPSLSITSGEDGKIVLKCFGGCATQAIIEALGLRMADLFSDAPRTNDNGHHEKRREPKPDYPPPWDWERLGLLEAAYPYVDEGCVLLYEVLRSKDKHFSQRRPDAKGGWIWNLGDVRRVPYRLPELIEAVKRGETVYVVEGEKDAETLRALGLTATCNSGGAGKWLPDFAEFMAGATVVILPDHDEPGRKHGDSVAQSLHGKLASIRVVNLPGLPEKGDTSDWLAMGYIRDELKAIVDATPEWIPTSTVKVGYNLTSLGDLMNEPEQHVQWLLEDILPMSGTGLLAGKPKAGKTTLARHLALCVARGERFLDRSTVKGPVIYLALEEKRAEVRKHFEDLGATGSEQILIHAASAPQKAVEELRVLAIKHKPVLIIVDPLFRFIRVKDSSAYAEVTLALEPLHNLARETGAHVLCVHHMGKGERAGGDAILGSTAIFGAVDSALLLKRGERYRTLASVQRYGKDLEETVLEFDQDRRAISLGQNKETAEIERMKSALREYLGDQKEPIPENPILNDVEGRKGLKVKALREMVNSGEVIRQGKGGPHSPFHYALLHLVPVVPTIHGEQENKTDLPAVSPRDTDTSPCSRDFGLFDSNNENAGTSKTAVRETINL